MNAIFSRQSVRKFEERAVEEEKIEKILRAAMAAPSAKNQQPWEFFVVTDRKVLQALSETTPYSMCVKNAPAAFVLASRRDGLIVPEFRDIDMAIATENILLEIEALGLGAVMIGVAPSLPAWRKPQRFSIYRILSSPLLSFPSATAQNAAPPKTATIPPASTGLENNLPPPIIQASAHPASLQL